MTTFKYKDTKSGSFIYVKKAQSILEADKAFLKAKKLNSIPHHVSCIPVFAKETKKNFPLYEYILYVLNKDPKSVQKIVEEISCVSTKKAVQSTLEKLQKKGFAKKVILENNIKWKILA